MDWIIVMVLVLGIQIVLAVWLMRRASEAKERMEELSHSVRVLKVELFRLKEELETARATKPPTAPQPGIIAPRVEAPPPVVHAPPPVMPQVRPVLARLASVPPMAPLPPPSRPMPERIAPAAGPPVPSNPVVNWEQFMGVKLFAWIGGLALFIGVAFFVKYSFDNNLVPPGLRAALGGLAGLGLLAGGVVMSRRNYPALSQTLCATGLVILYTVTFACRAVYHFDFFGAIPTFLLMALITVAGIVLADRLDALVVAILGMLGGFLTPILVSTGQDNPLGLFGYIAILDIGLILVAQRRRWFFVAALAALGTGLMQIGWAAAFFEAEKYVEGNKILVVLAVLLGFNALYLAAAWWVKTRRASEGEDAPASVTGAIGLTSWLSGSMLGLAALALAFSGWFLSFEPLAQRPVLMFGFVFLIDAGVVALALADDGIAAAQSIAGVAVFGLLGYWTEDWLNNELLNAALGFYFVFAVMHSVLPLLLRRGRGEAAAGAAIHIFPLLALALMLAPVIKLAEVSFLVWPFILLVDLLAIALAALTATLLPVLAVLLLTLAAIGALIFKIPSDLTGLPGSFFLLGAFIVFFVAASVWLARKFKPEAVNAGIQLTTDPRTPEEMAGILPACSVVLPFLLLIMATLRLRLANPSPVFGLGLLLVVLLLGVTKLFSIDWMPAIGLACVTALECAWHLSDFDLANPNLPINLMLAVVSGVLRRVRAVSIFIPAAVRRQGGSVGRRRDGGAAAILPRPPFCHGGFPEPFMGLLPAAFAIPALLSLADVVEKNCRRNKNPAWRNWLGSAAWRCFSSR